MAALPSLPLAREAPPLEACPAPFSWGRGRLRGPWPRPLLLGGAEAPLAPPTGARAQAADVGGRGRLVLLFVCGTVNPGKLPGK